jgi:hypothetical protein
MAVNRVAELLLYAKGLVDTPPKWTTGSSARDAKRKRVYPVVPEAVCFCMTGALSRARWDTAETDEVFGMAHSLLPWERDYWYVQSVPAWNDFEGRTHAQVLAAFDSAAAKANSLKDMP